MAVVATGFFDGVHLGHRLVIDTLLSEARKRSEQSVIVTFWPHPRNVLQQDARKLRLITSRNEKIEMMQSLGVDRVEVLPFTREFASLSAERYISEVLPQFDCRRLVLGYDTRLGADLKGPSQIRELYPESVTVSAARDEDGTIISSTKIRQALDSGNITIASRMLGYQYELSGIVVSGNQLGRTIGFPTANMQVCDPLKIIPARGVYLTEVETLGNRYSGMTNIGVRPTVSNAMMPVIETNIFDFDEMIYGLDIKLRFIRRIRDERKFSSLEALKAQLSIDRDFCMKNR